MRAGNAAGWGDWSAVISGETTGLPSGGSCLHDDAPCTERNQAMTDVNYLHNGEGCLTPPDVTLVGGNCRTYYTVNYSYFNGSSVVQEIVDSSRSGQAIFDQVIEDTLSGPFRNDSIVSYTSVSNYTSCGTPAVWRAVLDSGGLGVVVRFEEVSKGDNYTSKPQVVFSGGNCTLLPDAEATIRNGGVRSVSVRKACLSPGGNANSREEIQNDADGSSFLNANRRKNQRPEIGAQCGWNIAPQKADGSPNIPTGYFLMVSFTEFDIDADDQLRIYDTELPQGRTITADMFEDARTPDEFNGLTPLLNVRGGETLPATCASNSQDGCVVARTGNAQVVFNAGAAESSAKTFVMQWELQLQQPPVVPVREIPSAEPSSITSSSAKLTWPAFPSTIPVVRYRVEYWQAYCLPTLTDLCSYSDAVGVGENRIIEVDAPALEADVLNLANGTTYLFQVQAWSDLTNTDLRSAWSKNISFTTLSLASSWYVSPTGSALTGKGTKDSPWPPDLQGRIDAAQVANGHELVLLPGTYGNAFLRGGGSAEQLNLGGKLLSIRGEAGAASTIIDCQGGRSRFFTFNNSEPPSVVISGLTVRNCGGHVDGRGAIFINSSSPTFTDMVFEHNVAERTHQSKLERQCLRCALLRHTPVSLTRASRVRPRTSPIRYSRL